MKSELSPADRIRNARRMYKIASQGMLDIAFQAADPERAHEGFANVITHGRAAIEAIQKLKRDQLPTFEDWYRPWKVLLYEDPFLTSIWELRNNLAHEGTMPPTSVSLKVGIRGPMSGAEMVESLGEPPSGVTVLGYFFGDSEYARNGWDVMYPDGTTGRVYADPLGDTANMKSELGLRKVPGTFRGRSIGEVTFGNVARAYLDFIDEFISAAVDEFDS